MAVQPKFEDAFKIDKVPSEFINQLKENYGKTANIVAAKVPADPEAKTSSGSELRTNYKGYVVAISPDYVAQRVDTGGTKSNIVVHERAALDVPAIQGTGELPPIAAKFKEGKINSFDVAINYGADGKGSLYARDRKMDEIQLAAKTLEKHSGLDGAKLATFEKNLKGAVGNYKEVHYEKLREQAAAFERRNERQSAAHNIVGQDSMSREASR
jgi:hypothetical protein